MKTTVLSIVLSSALSVAPMAIGAEENVPEKPTKDVFFGNFPPNAPEQHHAPAHH